MTQISCAFQGERGAYSEAAAQRILAVPLKPVPCVSFDDVFEAVGAGAARVGIIPIENSLIGSIHRTYDLLLDSSLSIVGETYVRVNHCLMARRKARLGDLRQVFSHPVALEQCRELFRDNPHLEAIPYYDTAGAARMVAESSDTGSAAIASASAAEFYGLTILKRAVEDKRHNYTRFLLLSRKPIRVNGPAKTSIVFSMKDQPGVLFKALSVFALREISLTKIESRPVREKAWKYHFYLDFLGATSDERVGHALDHLAEITHFVKILGSYPVGDQEHPSTV